MNRLGISSIKQFLVVSLLALLAVSFIANFFINRYLASVEIDELYDAQLAQTSRILQGLIDRPVSEIDFDNLNNALLNTLKVYEEQGEEERTDEGHGYEGKLAIQIWDGEGNLLVKTPTSPMYALSLFKDGYYLKQYQGYRWYVFTHQLPNNGLWIIIAERGDIRGELEDHLSDSVMLNLLITGLLLALSLVTLVHLALKPLQRLVGQLEDRDIDRLEPVNLGTNSPTELRPLVLALNGLMARLKLDFERERRFLGDVAHELRTPLAALRLNAQLGLKASDGAQTRRHLHRVIEGVDRSTHLVTQLLTLARLDAPELGEPQPIALGASLRELYSQLLPQAQVHLPAQLHLQLEQDELWGYPILVQVLLRNLLENALKFAPANSPIKVFSHSNPQGHLILRLEDQGPGVPAQQLPQLGKRFFREASADSAGTGLGLSIVARIAELHRASLRFYSCKPQGLGIELDFPPPPITASHHRR